MYNRLYRVLGVAGLCTLSSSVLVYDGEVNFVLFCLSNIYCLVAIMVIVVKSQEEGASYSAAYKKYSFHPPHCSYMIEMLR
jgi:hypothetical protein